MFVQKSLNLLEHIIQWYQGIQSYALITFFLFFSHRKLSFNKPFSGIDQPRGP